MKNTDIDKTSDEEKKNHTKTKIIISVIIIIIIILLLLTSCTSGLFGKIGNIFTGESTHKITDTTGDKEIITNKELVFDSLKGNISIDDDIYKIGFKKGNLGTNEITCTTSDAKIATCFVKSDYVEVIPKKEGTVNIYIKADTNGKIYQGTHYLTISKSKRKILLSEYKDNIYLDESNRIVLPYTLKGFNGSVKVNVSVSNDNIADAEVKDGKLYIIGKSEGKTNIVLSVNYKNKKYSTTFNLRVYNQRPLKPTTSTSHKKTKTTKSTKKTKSSKTTKTTKTNSSNTTTKKPTTTSKPITKPTTTTTTTTTTTSTVDITKSGENRLSNISSSVGTLSPSFNQNTNNYKIKVGENTNQITINVTKKDNKETLEYYVNGSRVASLNNINLASDRTNVKVKVIAENGSTNTYSIDVVKNESTNNYLSSITTSVSSLDPGFNSSITNYNVLVNYDTTNITINSTKEDSKATVQYKVNGSVVPNLNNVALNEGNNKLEIIVTSESGASRVYTINVKRPTRTIKFNEVSYEGYIEDVKFNIPYKVYQDGVVINDYNISDISVSIPGFNGTYKLAKGILEITPKTTDINNTYAATLTYNNKTTNINLKVKMKDYFVKALSNNYDIDIVNGIGTRNIIINTNTLGSSIRVENIVGGIRLKSNSSIIEIVSSDTTKAKVSYIASDNIDATSYYSIHVEAYDAGNSKITIKSSVYGISLNDFEVNLNISKKYKLIIDANGGYFDAFTDKYDLLVSSTEEIDLSKYVAYKDADITNCTVYTIESYNTKSDGTGIRKAKDEHIMLTQDLTLYAIYGADTQIKKETENQKLYLSEVDIFHNEEYFNKYNVDNIIYPGAKGSYVLTIKNTSSSTITLKDIELEENNFCLANGCINMAYIIKYALPNDSNYTFYYGSENNYKILNKDSNSTKTLLHDNIYQINNKIPFGVDGIDIPANGEVEISLIWKWESIDDNLDTAIGSQTNDVDYDLTVSLDFVRENNNCTITN